MRGAATLYVARGRVAEHGEATGRLIGKTRRFADSCWLDSGTPPPAKLWTSGHRPAWVAGCSSSVLATVDLHNW
jgi:hypothetical protein